MKQTVMYSQLQPWSSIGVSPYMEQVSGSLIPPRIEKLYKTPRPHPWRPTLGYETIQVKPLPSQTITNQLVDPCYVPPGMITKPLEFPNLVTGFNKHPSHAARVALYTRHTPDEWKQKDVQFRNEINSSCNHSNQLRESAIRVVRETEEKLNQGQRESSQLLGQRITDIGFWERELANELDKIIIENNKMQECMRTLQRAIQDIEGPLHVAEECLYHREKRQGLELIHDEPEQTLFNEIEVERNCQKKLKVFIDKCTEQLKNGRAVQHEIEININNKNLALGIDTMCHQLNVYSPGLQYYKGVESYDSYNIDGESWVEASNAIVKKSQLIRAQSGQLQNDITTKINTVSHELWKAWSLTNNALARRVIEISEAKRKLLIYLKNIQHEIFAVERNIQLITKAIGDKSAALKVAQTRLEARLHRPQAESCKDAAQLKLSEEVESIKLMVDELHIKLQECEAQHQQLLRTRVNLEDDLKAKMDALYIDNEKCMGLRRSYPIINKLNH
ncbi:tektin-3-like [Chelonus insularis]|uniref:tektin-3-like n=1 Tax=Chelonus insularis TaxID=460826 RepID=UPI00158DBEFB|nr:tektin-3-like [Chelonus insularis]